MKFSVSLPLAALLASAFCAHAEGYAQNDTEGVWSSGYQRGSSEKILLSLTQIGEVGKLGLKFTRWQGRSAICDYVFKRGEEGAVQPVLNESSGTPAQCPTGFAFTLARSGADAMAMRLSGADFLPEAEFAANLRPMREGDRHAPIAKLTTQGVAAGMDEALVRQTLEAAGYAEHPDWALTLQGRDWTQQTLYFVKGRGETDNDWADAVWVEFSSVIEGAEGARRALVVGRDLRLTERDAVSELTLKKALEAQYGPGLDNNDARAYDRQGRNLTTSREKSERCKNGSLQAVPFTLDQRGRRSEFGADLYCGPELGASIRTERATGLATALETVLTDPDEIWADFWAVWSHGEGAKLRAGYDAVTSATGAAPKL